MSILPLITFRAGYCDIETKDTKPWTVTTVPDPGYIYLYVGAEDELVHFCWRRRFKPLDDPDLDLVMIPGDGTFTPYTGKENSESSENVTSPTNGRIFVLKFSSSSQRHLFWLQSKSRGADNWFSPFDLKLGQIVDMILQGNEVNVMEELAEVRRNGSGPGPEGDGDDGDEDMEDAPPNRYRSNSTGGAGADATGGDIREEGEEAREGGADGGRAASSAPGTASQDPTSSSAAASALVQNLLNSLQGTSSGSSIPQQALFTTLNDLLTPSTTIGALPTLSERRLDALLSSLPPQVVLLGAADPPTDDASDADADPETVQAVIMSLDRAQKEAILARVLRSPQFHQSLASLTGALREGGLPSIAEALGVKVRNGGFVEAGGGVPMGGGAAVEAFLEGVKGAVEQEDEDGDDEEMDEA